MADGQEQQQTEQAEVPEAVSVGDDIAAAMKELGWDGDSVVDGEAESGADQGSDANSADDGASEADGAADGSETAVSDESDDDSGDLDDAAGDADGEDDPGEEAAGEEAAGVEPPEHWSQADRDAFAELPDEAKPLYLDKVKSLERGYQEKFETLSEDARAGSSLREVFQPFQDQLDREGIDRVGALRRLVAAHDLLTRDGDQGMQWLAGQQAYRPRDPAATVKAIAAAWGVDLGASDEGQADEVLDPAANSKITALESEIAELKNRNSSSDEAEQQRRMGDAQATLQAFTGAKDDAGKPKHPHYEAVKATMGVLIAAGKAQTLEDAYEQAIWSDPALRGDLLKQQQATQKAKEDEKARLQRNKRASRTIKSDKSGGQAAAADRSLRDEIKHQFDEAGIT